MPKHYLAKYKKDFGRPCPRIELYPLNEDASQLIMMALNEYAAPLLAAFSLTFRTREEASEAILRASRALGSEKFSELMESLRKTK